MNLTAGTRRGRVRQRKWVGVDHGDVVGLCGGYSRGHIYGKIINVNMSSGRDWSCRCS